MPAVRWEDARSFALAALVMSLPAAASAQATVHVEVDVHVDVPPAPVVVVEQPVIVEQPPVVVIEPAPAPSTEPEAPRAIAPVLSARGQILVSDEHALAALGGAAAIGGSLHREWSGALVAGYLGDPGGGRSELDLGIEIAKDFDPASVLGFYVVAGMGAAFPIDDIDDAPRMMGQLGIGARMSLDEDLALTLDARGVLRYALPEARDLDDEGTLSGGAMLTLGLAMRL